MTHEADGSVSFALSAKVPYGQIYVKNNDGDRS